MQGRGGMGSHKHGISGHATKSPKLRLAIKLEAEKDEKKSKKHNKMFSSVKDALEQNKG